MAGNIGIYRISKIRFGRGIPKFGSAFDDFFQKQKIHPRNNLRMKNSWKLGNLKSGPRTTQRVTNSWQKYFSYACVNMYYTGRFKIPGENVFFFCGRVSSFLKRMKKEIVQLERWISRQETFESRHFFFLFFFAGKINRTATCKLYKQTLRITREYTFVWTSRATTHCRRKVCVCTMPQSVYNRGI